MDNLVKLENVTKLFHASGGMFKQGAEFRAVDSVSLDVIKGCNLGIVGESGSGKTTIARMICNIHKPEEGQIYYKGCNLTDISKSDTQTYRKNVQMVYQDPFNSLNPKLTIKSALADGIKQHITKDASEINARLKSLMDMVGLNYEHLNRYPHEFSGGQRQRISIARALSLEPELIIADEPVSSLDVSVQAQILNLMKQLSTQGTTFVLISHNLAVVSYLCEYVAVMYKGKLVEYGKTAEILANPQSDYTKKLIEASVEFQAI